MSLGLRTVSQWLVLITVLAACTKADKLPGAPAILAIAAGNTSAIVSFAEPIYSGQSRISTYVAQCRAEGEVLSARGQRSPLEVFGLSNGVSYACSVTASNAAGTGADSTAISVTPKPNATHSLAAEYRQAAWSRDVSVTFPDECTMTVWPSERPNHTVNPFYLMPVVTQKTKGISTVVGVTRVSAMQLELRPFSGSSAQEPIQLNICPSKSPTPTAVNAGAIGVLISGSTLFGAAEISGHRATTLKDNTSYSWKTSDGRTVMAQFIDSCNGHPTPVSAGNSYHYHGLSDCVSALVDHQHGPSHLIGVALDGFPIYGDKDMSGKTIVPSRLDSCNGIFSATPEFPQGVYHYILPFGVKERNASMRCYGGVISRKQLALAESSGFCYAPLALDPALSNEKMTMRK